MAKKCTYDYFMRFISSEITAEEAELLDDRKGDEWEKCYDEYMDILVEKHFQEKISRKALWQRTMKNLYSVIQYDRFHGQCSFRNLCFLTSICHKGERTLAQWSMF